MQLRKGAVGAQQRCMPGEIGQRAVKLAASGTAPLQQTPTAKHAQLRGAWPCLCP
jgi:hypothetical protein